MHSIQAVLFSIWRNQKTQKHHRCKSCFVCFSCPVSQEYVLKEFGFGVRHCKACAAVRCSACKGMSKAKGCRSDQRNHMFVQWLCRPRLRYVGLWSLRCAACQRNFGSNNYDGIASDHHRQRRSILTCVDCTDRIAKRLSKLARLVKKRSRTCRCRKMNFAIGFHAVSCLTSDVGSAASFEISRISGGSLVPVGSTFSFETFV